MLTPKIKKVTTDIRNDYIRIKT
jgi:hypothetical protein